jgi:hypothetical protein
MTKMSIATLVLLAAILIPYGTHTALAEVAPKVEQTEKAKVPRVVNLNLDDKLPLKLKPAAYGSCDYQCGFKPFPPLGCGPEAICACSGSYCKEPCGWVFTNCH